MTWLGCRGKSEKGSGLSLLPNIRGIDVVACGVCPLVAGYFGPKICPQPATVDTTSSVPSIRLRQPIVQRCSNSANANIQQPSLCPSAPTYPQQPSSQLPTATTSSATYCGLVGFKLQQLVGLGAVVVASCTSTINSPGQRYPRGIANSQLRRDSKTSPKNLSRGYLAHSQPRPPRNSPPASRCNGDQGEHFARSAGW